MGRRTRRSNAKRAQARQNGVYGVQQAEIVAIPTTSNAIEPEEGADLSFFGGWWETNIAQPMNTKRLRPFVYTGDSDRTVLHKYAENSQALISCPMKTISSYFVSTCPKDTAQLKA
ncbi:hypothetical protein H257_19174 [Aphanomyces astaci]|uniref:Uncharacterized protein n=1 Tax=Aphanomyces astaci TaxID=112090 RepID=W4F8T5_APHAT|nr:hypothetical protein H257_19174 [Aphanomyces astaci]ETV63895.1 hypothetical protein H257_19174 [Aphanomyces astaci]|eukprot:XP_009846622.1 hypothetical protein H257_19174 [Aphanomyces astaci]